MMLGVRRLAGAWGGRLGAWKGAAPPSLHHHAIITSTAPSTTSITLQNTRVRGNRWCYRKVWQSVWGVRSLASNVGGTLPPVTIASVTTDTHTNMLKVVWGDGRSDVYPFLWLRDNCRCPTCYHPGAASRTLLIQDLDPHTFLASVQVMEGGGGLVVTWNDGHSGTYDADWLYDHAFNDSRRRARVQVVRLERQYWGSELLKDLPSASFSELLMSDAALLKWLERLEVFGFVHITDAPAEVGQVRRLAERVAFVKKTHYGEDFTVVAKPDPSNVAYLSGPLQLHADLPYYEYKPGVQLIHCVVQYAGTGGESQVSDGVAVARELQRCHPTHYRALTTTPVDWYDIGTDEGREFYKVLRLPVICTNADGEIWRINMSQPQRDSHFSVAVEDVAGWYKAMLEFHRLLIHPRYCCTFKMAPGTILCLDNLRVVHGRTGYLSGTGTRHIQGCYLDWDEVRSRRRVLHQHLQSSS